MIPSNLTHAHAVLTGCWPCVCDTQDFIRVDTKNVTLAGGETRQYHFAVVGNPCEHPEKLREPFTQPFYSRGPTTLEREAAELRCDANGKLVGASLSDGGYPIISMFFDTADSDNDLSAVVPLTGEPRPGRISHASDGTAFQDEFEYGPMCEDRARNGYNSGMGEIFRRAASITPVKIRRDRPALEPASSSHSDEHNASGDESCESTEGM